MSRGCTRSSFSVVDRPVTTQRTERSGGGAPGGAGGNGRNNGHVEHLHHVITRLRVSGNDSIRPRVKALIRIVAVVALTILAAVPAAAADTGWTIDAFRADITIRPNASLTIVESIDVDFGPLQKHGIVRTIPTKYRYDEKHDRTYAVSVDGVTDGSGRPWMYQLTRGD